MVQHPDFDNLCSDGHYHYTSRLLFESLLHRARNRQSLRECVQYATTKEVFCDPNLWRQVPQVPWKDKELCLELLPWIPSLYACLPHNLRTDRDVAAAILFAKPEIHIGFSWLVREIPFETQVEHPDLVLRVLIFYGSRCLRRTFRLPYRDNENVRAYDLWRNREEVLALRDCDVWHRHGRVAEEAMAGYVTDRDF